MIIYGQVRIEAALTLRALAEVDPTCVGGLVSYVITMLNALRENLPFEKVKFVNVFISLFIFCFYFVVYLLVVDDYGQCSRFFSTFRLLKS